MLQQMSGVSDKNCAKNETFLVIGFVTGYGVIRRES